MTGLVFVVKIIYSLEGFVYHNTLFRNSRHYSKLNFWGLDLLESAGGRPNFAQRILEIFCGQVFSLIWILKYILLAPLEYFVYGGNLVPLIEIGVLGW